jgi:hypothetical protein
VRIEVHVLDTLAAQLNTAGTVRSRTDQRDLTFFFRHDHDDGVGSVREFHPCAMTGSILTADLCPLGERQDAAHTCDEVAFTDGGAIVDEGVLPKNRLQIL